MINELKIVRLADESALKDMLLLKAEQAGEENEEFNADYEMWCLKIFFRGREDMWIAYLSDMPVGYVLGRVNGQPYRINYVFVANKFRRRGIGKALEETVIRNARDIGCKIVSTDIIGDNPASLALQRKVGFRIHENETYSLAELRFD